MSLRQRQFWSTHRDRLLMAAVSLAAVGLASLAAWLMSR